MKPETGQREDGRSGIGVRARQPGHPADLWQRASISDIAVQRLAAAIAPGCRLTDLGGTLSLNLRLDPPGLVLRVHRPFVSRHRVLALQAVRRKLADQGLVVPLPVAHGHSTVMQCGDRWAELETYLPHEQPPPTPVSYLWLFGAIGRLHGALATLDLEVPRPTVATYAPPGSLRRWLQHTEAVVQDNAGVRDIVQLTRRLLQRLQNQWTPAIYLPRQLVHGDARLGNVGRSPQGETVYLDFGFLALRPRIHELAYSVAFMLLARKEHADPARAWRQIVPAVLAAYESAQGSPLSHTEHQALVPYTASVPLYFSAVAGFVRDPVRELHAHRPFLSLSEWLLAQ